MCETKTLLSTILFFALLACADKPEFTKGDRGMEYKIAQRDATGVPVNYGQYLKLWVTQKYGDTVLRDALKTGFEYQLIDSTQMSRDAWNIFHEACMNNSIVFRVSPDSVFAKTNPLSRKKLADWVITTFKVMEILPNRDSVIADRERDQQIFMQMKQQMQQ